MDSDKSTTTNNNPSTRKSWRSRLIVEPLTVTFMLAYGLLITIRVEYLNKRLSEEANFTQPSGNTSIVCLLNTSSDEYERYVEVQTQTSYWTLYLAVSQSVPALFSANLLGALSDARGRRIAMVFPIIGFAVYAIVNALVAQLHWPLYALLAGTFALGLCGDFLTFVACSFAYVADTTTKKQRTYRMVILECLTTLGAGTGQVLVGFMIQVTGYPPVYYTILGIMVVSALYVFLLPESHPSGNGKVPGVESAPIESSPRRDLTTTKFVRSLADLFRPDPKGRCWKMVTYNYILFQSILIITAFLSISVLFAEGEPFCWSSALIGIFNGLTFIFSGFGLVVGGYVIRLCFSDHATMQASLLSFVSCLILAALSKNNIMLFCVTAVGALRMLAMPICRAKMSKLIGPEEQGIMFACSGCIQSIGTLLSPVIFNALYPLTLSVSSGFIFVVMAITFSIPILLTLALQIDDRRRTVAYISVQNRPSTEYRETEHRVSED